MSAPGPLLLLRVDVSRQHGSGHLMRSKALGDSWKRAGGRVEFATTSDLVPYAEWLSGWPVHHIESPRASLADATETGVLAAQLGAAWVVADSYHFDSAWQQAFGDKTPLLLFDDYGHGAPHTAELVLNQGPGASEQLYTARSPETKLLLGPRFAVLRDQFTPWRTWRREIAPKAKRLLVTFGGTDPAGVTLTAVEALRGLPLEAEIVVGAGNAQAAKIEELCAGTNLHVRRNVLDMPDLMAACDFALCAGGSTTLEAAFLQLPQLLITVADNQLLLADSLVAAAAAQLLGWYTEVTAAQIRAAVLAMAEAPPRAAMSAAAAKLVDGLGGERVVTHMRARTLRLRPAATGDERITWEWGNDAVTRAFFFNTRLIPWEEHQAWFRARLADPNVRFYIGEDPQSTGEPLGLVRFSLSGDEADVSVVLGPASRGRGYAPALILRGIHALLREGGRTRLIHAWIKPGNTASRAAFLRAGYQHVGQGETRGHVAEHYTLSSGDVPEWERLG